MEAFIASSAAGPTGARVGPTRVLGLGNELVADDAAGVVAARRVAEHLGADAAAPPVARDLDSALVARVFEVPGIGTVEILETALTGMYLVEAIVGAGRLIVLDSVVSGTAAPGTVRELTERDLAGARGGSPHGIGLLEALDLARALGLEAPVDVRFVTVEAGDSVTIGGAMTARVSEAVDLVVDRAIAIIGQGRSGALPMVQ